MHEHDLTQGWMLVNTLANIAIVAGYVLVPFTVLRYLPLTKNVLFAGTLFFLTCALTHISMAFDFVGSEIMVFNHVIQAGAVGWFVIGFFLLLRKAALLRKTKQTAKVHDTDGLT